MAPSVDIQVPSFNTNTLSCEIFSLTAITPSIKRRKPKGLSLVRVITKRKKKHEYKGRKHHS